tara:strand:+ start:358 stop:558 length:201 start_codon:yes stop_codon:yes gene_type:complete
MKYLVDLIGKNVQIYPSDTYSKEGIIKEITDMGILFEITKGTEDGSFKAGKLHFISYSARLTFQEI